MTEEYPMLKCVPALIFGALLIAAVSFAAEHDAHMPREASTPKSDAATPHEGNSRESMAREDLNHEAMDHQGISREGVSHSSADGRKEIEMPAPMKAHMLSNMRAHQTAVSEAMLALSRGDGLKAAKIVEDQLGVTSPHSGPCKPSATSGALGDMPAQMAKFMGEDMRAMGMTMHEQASKFAVTAATLKPGGDIRPALAELGKTVDACNGCHSAYRLK